MLQKDLSNGALSKPKAVLSLSLISNKTKQQIDLHNIWGEFNPDEHDRLEREYRQLLQQSADKLCIIFGDFNLPLAPTHEYSENLTTGIVPTIFNKLYSSEPFTDRIQIPNCPNGGFYKDQNGSIHQIPIETLDFENGQDVKDTRHSLSIELFVKKFRILALDRFYDVKKSDLQAVLGDNVEFSYSIESNFLNLKQTVLSFENNTKIKLEDFFEKEYISLDKNRFFVKFCILEMDFALQPLTCFRLAQKKLQEATTFLDEDNDLTKLLKSQGQLILNLLKSKKHIFKPDQLRAISFLMRVTIRLIQNPTDYDVRKSFFSRVKSCTPYFPANKEIGKLIPVILAAVLGLALIATAVIHAISTFGVGTPFSLAAIALVGKIGLGGTFALTGTTFFAGTQLLGGLNLYNIRKKTYELTQLSDDLLTTAKSSGRVKYDN